jgi:hypothetical protein
LSCFYSTAEVKYVEMEASSLQQYSIKKVKTHLADPWLRNTGLDKAPVKD